MERFISEPNIEERDQLNQAPKLKILKDPLDDYEPKISDLCLADSFLDFDSIKEFFEDNSPNTDTIGLEEIEFRVTEKSLNMGEEEKTNFGEVISCESGTISDVAGRMVKVEEALEGQEVKNLNCSIEEEIGKVSLVGELGSVPVDGSGVKSEIVNDEKESESDLESESESSTASSSSSSSSSDDGEEEEDEEEKEEMKEVKRELALPVELEEGEIEGVYGEEMVGKTDDNNSNEEDEDDEEIIGGDDVDIDDIIDGDENGAAAMEGPIRSKNELQMASVEFRCQTQNALRPFELFGCVMGGCPERLNKP